MENGHAQKHFALRCEFRPLGSLNLVNFHLSHLSTEETLPTLAWGSLVVFLVWVFWGFWFLFLFLFWRFGGSLLAVGMQPVQQLLLNSN